MSPDLPERTTPLNFNRAVADANLSGNLLVAHAEYQVSKNLSFSSRQSGHKVT